MSAAHPPPRAASAGDRSPSGRMVAVIERRGRFLTAEPLFDAPSRGPAPPSGRSRRSAPTIARVSSARGVDAPVPGELVLLELEPRGAARVVRKIGRPDVARDLIEALMLDRGLARGFGDDVEEEAVQAARRVARSSEERRDLRALATFTIDPASARDFDDAISAERISDGRARVWVHIADVAAHVRDGGALDVEARERATSVYVPGSVEPMLPHALSSDACSLMPDVDRPAVTVEMEVQEGRVERTSFYRSAIRSDARLDYEQVDRVFAGTESAREPWAAPLAVAREVAAAMGRLREQSGALVLDSPEPEFEFGPDGNVSGIALRAQTEAHKLIEQLMVAANEAVASFLAARRVPCLYRVHEPPEAAGVERLVDQLASLEVPTPPVPDTITSSQAAELMGEISARVQAHVGRTGKGRIALAALVLRALKQASYSPRNVGHAGLHSAAYCHFTSPIRRYPDIVCHRALLSAVGASESEPRASELGELGAWTSDRERDAMRLERDADDMAACALLEQELFGLGPSHVFDGEVAGLIAAGAFVAFGPAEEGAPPFEGMLPVRVLRTSSGERRNARGRAPAREERGGRGAPAREERDWWELNEEGTILSGERSGSTLRLGDAVAVRVARVDTVRGRVDLVPG